MQPSAESLQRERALIADQLTQAQNEAQTIRSQLQSQQEILSQSERDISDLQSQLEEVRALKAEVLAQESQLESQLIQKESALNSLQNNFSSIFISGGVSTSRQISSLFFPSIIVIII